MSTRFLCNVCGYVFWDLSDRCYCSYTGLWVPTGEFIDNDPKWGSDVKEEFDPTDYGDIAEEKHEDKDIDNGKTEDKDTNNGKTETDSKQSGEKCKKARHSEHDPTKAAN